MSGARIIHLIRLKNARALAARFRTHAEFAVTVGISKSYISHVFSRGGYRNIGSVVAERIEKTFDKPRGWLDEDHDKPDQPINASSDKDAEIEVQGSFLRRVDTAIDTIELLFEGRFVRAQKLAAYYNTVMAALEELRTAAHSEQFADLSQEVVHD